MSTRIHPHSPSTLSISVFHNDDVDNLSIFTKIISQIVFGNRFSDAAQVKFLHRQLHVRFMRFFTWNLQVNRSPSIKCCVDRRVYRSFRFDDPMIESVRTRLHHSIDAGWISERDKTKTSRMSIAIAKNHCFATTKKRRWSAPREREKCIVHLHHFAEFSPIISKSIFFYLIGQTADKNFTFLFGFERFMATRLFSCFFSHGSKWKI